MGIGVSVFLITLGAILRFAISATLIGNSVNIHTIGVILMIVGGASLVLQLLLTGRARSIPEDGRGRLYKGDQPPPPA